MTQQDLYELGASLTGRQVELLTKYLDGMPTERDTDRNLLWKASRRTAAQEIKNIHETAIRHAGTAGKTFNNRG